MAKSTIKRPQVTSIFKNYTATSVQDFIDQVITDVLSMGQGIYDFSCAYTGYWYCRASASAQSSTRCVLFVIPQIENVSHVYFASHNAGVSWYKKIALEAF